MPDDDIGTVRWFGESWDAPICDPRAHIKTPVGEVCGGHEHMHENSSLVIEPGDQGVTVPYYHDGITDVLAYHLDCWLHEIGVDRIKG